MKNEFAKFLNTNEIRFKYAKGMRDIIGKEIHPFHEILFFIDGDAEFVCEGGSTVLSPYTAVIIPKGTFHCFITNKNEENYTRCAINFEKVSELDELINLKFQKITLSQDDSLINILLKMKALFDTPLSEAEQKILLKAYLAQMLVSIKSDASYLPEVTFSPIIKETLDYINDNLSTDVSINKISARLHVSPSNLAHLFKKELHIPMHKYVLEKRLILANRKLRDGISPTQAAIECGFKDYSGFYKQYKKMFGISPSKKD